MLKCARHSVAKQSSQTLFTSIFDFKSITGNYFCLICIKMLSDRADNLHANKYFLNFLANKRLVFPIYYPKI